jgi:hypothetical protein
MERPKWAPGDIDLERPSVARVYDYWLGGAHNFAADRAAGRKALEAMPDLRSVITANRVFLRRAVRYLLGVGVRQFLDLGSGIPTVGNVHEIAAGAKVVYVDIDPVAVAHSRAILDGDPLVRVLQQDIREPASVLRSPDLRGLLDLAQPVAVLMTAVLHFVPDADGPRKIVAEYRDNVPVGSYLAVSHAGYDDAGTPRGLSEARSTYDRDVTPMTFRDRTEFTAFFDGFDVVEPGVVPLPLWRPGSPDDVTDDARIFPGFAAVGRKS